MTPHIQMQLLSQAVTQCKLKTVTWFRQLLRKPHCFSAETLPVKYYLDRKAAADWRMLICTTFHKHQRDSHYTPDVAQAFCWHCRGVPLMKHICPRDQSHWPPWVRQALNREMPGAPGFQGVETLLGFNKYCARQPSHGELHTSGVRFVSHVENWGNYTV